ncbi:MAG: sensor histidine kinase, partial [Clostridia bacterium]|nr:sensor histidine kinase [Clostridia bacterium]
NGLIPKEVIDPVDLCIVFGNALDNAIEACLKLPHEEMKKISISAKQNADLFFIKITNPVVKQVKIRNNMIMTTKEDVFSHGIGLYSIRKVAEKYNGHLDLQCNDRLFITEIDFITN